ncbi:hypothetical protein O9929_15015 [Vibrio lentus]|nr:hypothetical protein [Vibrio lentus]
MNKERVVASVRFASAVPTAIVSSMNWLNKFPSVSQRGISGRRNSGKGRVPSPMMAQYRIVATSSYLSPIVGSTEQQESSIHQETICQQR